MYLFTLREGERLRENSSREVQRKREKENPKQALP